MKMSAAERQRRHVAALERANEKQAAEIQRLRTAMVLAMADCDSALAGDGLMPTTRTLVKAAHAELLATLEKK